MKGRGEEGADDQHFVFFVGGGEIGADDEEDDEELECVVVEGALELRGDEAPETGDARGGGRRSREMDLRDGRTR